jgi:hypothetical protein
MEAPSNRSPQPGATAAQGGEERAGLRASTWAAILLAAFVAAIGSGLGGETAVRYLDDLATASAALVAMVLCGQAAGRHGGRLRLSWGLLAVALGLWSLGELIWAYYDLLLREPVPVPSWADVGYLGAIPFAAAGLLAQPALRARAAGKTRSVLDGLVIGAALFFVSWTALLGPLWRSTDLTTVGGLVALAYPLGDVVVLLLVVLVIRGTTSRDRFDLWCLLVGLLAMTLADGVYGYLTEVAGYSSGNLIDAGWFGAYLAIGVGAYSSRPGRATEPAPGTVRLTGAALVTPFLPAFAALGLAAARMELGHRPDRVAWTTAVLLVAVVLGRQLLLLLDLRSPDPAADLADRLVAALGSPAASGPGSPPVGRSAP